MPIDSTSVAPRSPVVCSRISNKRLSAPSTDDELAARRDDATGRTNRERPTETDWLAGVVGLEPANPSASYLIGIV